MAYSESTAIEIATTTTTNYLMVQDFVRGSIGPFPTDFTTTNITLQISNDNEDPTTWTDLKDATDTAVNAITGVAEGDLFALNENVFKFRFLRLSFATAQGAGTIGNEIPVLLIADN